MQLYLILTNITAQNSAVLFTNYGNSRRTTVKEKNYQSSIQRL